jgi:hypothetical protein
MSCSNYLSEKTETWKGAFVLMYTWIPALYQNENGICYFSEKHAALMRNGNGWLAENQNNVTKWIVISVS